MCYLMLLLVVVGCVCFCWMLPCVHAACSNAYVSLLLLRSWPVWQELSLVWTKCLSCVTSSHHDLDWPRAGAVKKDEDELFQEATEDTWEISPGCYLLIALPLKCVGGCLYLRLCLFIAIAKELAWVIVSCRNYFEINHYLICSSPLVTNVVCVRSYLAGTLLMSLKDVTIWESHCHRCHRHLRLRGHLLEWSVKLELDENGLLFHLMYKFRVCCLDMWLNVISIWSGFTCVGLACLLVHVCSFACLKGHIWTVPLSGTAVMI